jgi:hypothetical protein
MEGRQLRCSNRWWHRRGVVQMPSLGTCLHHHLPVRGWPLLSDHKTDQDHWISPPVWRAGCGGEGSMGLYDGPVAGCGIGHCVSVVAGALCIVAATLRALWTRRITQCHCLGYALTTLWFIAMSWWRSSMEPRRIRVRSSILTPCLIIFAVVHYHSELLSVCGELLSVAEQKCWWHVVNENDRFEIVMNLFSLLINCFLFICVMATIGRSSFGGSSSEEAVRRGGHSKMWPFEVSDVVFKLVFS